MVSYADFVTLLFALFVVLFAASRADRNKARQISIAVEEALHSPTLHPIKQQESAKLANPYDLQRAMQMLMEALKKEIRDGSVDLKLDHRGLVIGLNTVAFFPSGQDVIAPAAIPIIEKVTIVLNQFPNSLRIEGHTDSVPINTARFKSNWELSAARSLAVLHLMIDHFGVDERRLAVAGYAANHRAGPDDTEEGRRRNRRVDIVVLNQ